MLGLFFLIYFIFYFFCGDGGGGGFVWSVFCLMFSEVPRTSPGKKWSVTDNVWYKFVICQALTIRKLILVVIMSVIVHGEFLFIYFH